MTTIVTRAGKGTALTHAEVDANFNNLNTDKLESSAAASTYAPLANPVFTGDVQIQARGDLRLADDDSSHWVALQAPANVGANVTWTLPGVDGANGQVLSTNGSGMLNWVALSDPNAVIAVTANSPISSTGGTFPVISIQDGTAAQKGAVQLEDSVSSTSTSKAATPASVKSAYDLAAGALPKAGGTMTGNITFAAGQTFPAASIQDGTTQQKGIVQLSISTSSTSTTVAATPSAVKSAYDLADAALARSGGTMTGSITFAAGQTFPGAVFAGSIVDADISATAEIAVNKLADGAPRQLLQTDAAGTGVEWTNNVDVPGTLDVSSAATFDNNVTVHGDLTVNGTTVTVDAVNLVVEDKNIEIGKVLTPTDATADGGGITLKGTTDKTISWIDSSDAWTSSEHIDLANGKSYYINGAQVLSGTALGSGVTSSSLTSLGTIGIGVWQGTAIGSGYGGTGQTSYTDGQLLIGNTSTGDLSKATLTAGTGVTITNGNGTITIASTGTTYTAGDGLDLVADQFSVDLKANGGLVIESTELALDLSASAITGTLAVGDGGTGQTTYTDGQILIGNTAGELSKATITAGSNVTVTNGNGTITIASTDTNTTYTAGDGLDLVDTEFSADLKADGGLVIESGELAVDLGASSITGTLGVADGGTGQTSFTDGQLLIGNTETGGLNKATLTAGAGVSITNGNGTITIGATGGGGTTYTAGNGLVLDGNEFSVDLHEFGGLVIENGELAVDLHPIGGIGRVYNQLVLALGEPGIYGKLRAANGGTGHSSYEDGQLLIGNTSTGRLNKANLIAGNGISIAIELPGGYEEPGVDQPPGTITIEATGGGGTNYTAGYGLVLDGNEFSVDLHPIGGIGRVGNQLALFLGEPGIYGQLRVANGGTGHSSFTDGQLLIGNTETGRLNKANLIAGNGISITIEPGNVPPEDPEGGEFGGGYQEPGTITIEATGAVPSSGGTITGNVTLNAQADLRFGDGDSSHWVAFQAPATVSTNVTWTLPAADATVSGQVLSSNGAGTLSWITPSSTVDPVIAGMIF